MTQARFAAKPSEHIMVLEGGASTSGSPRSTPLGSPITEHRVKLTDRRGSLVEIIDNDGNRVIAEGSSRVRTSYTRHDTLTHTIVYNFLIFAADHTGITKQIETGPLEFITDTTHEVDLPLDFTSGNRLRYKADLIEGSEQGTDWSTPGADWETFADSP